MSRPLFLLLLLAAAPALAAELPLPAGPALPAAEDDLARSLTARVVSSGRVGAGLIVDGGRRVVTLWDLVRVGRPVVVESGWGHTAVGRIESVFPDWNLAVLALAEPFAETEAPSFTDGPPRPGDALTLRGHGGSAGLPPEADETRALLLASQVTARVASVAPTESGVAAFVIDRAPGDGDRGAPLFTTDGRVAGLVDREVEAGGGRALAVPGSALREALGAAPAAPYVRPAHASWVAGLVLGADNRPARIGIAGRFGFRIALWDTLQFEPFGEALIGIRGPFQNADEAWRAQDLWTEAAAGVDVGARLPLHAEGSRDYLVPTAGFRIGWERFAHANTRVVGDCAGGECGWTLAREPDAVRATRPGIDLGIDIRHGRLRFGYRYFLDPRDPAGGGFHRVLVTLDGFPFDISLGDPH